MRRRSRDRDAPPPPTKIKVCISQTDTSLLFTCVLTRLYLGTQLATTVAMFSSPTTRPSLADALKREGVFTDIALQDDGSISSSGLVTLSSPNKVDLETGGGPTKTKKKSRRKPQAQLLGTLSEYFYPVSKTFWG